jgi:hypothetical protein
MPAARAGLDGKRHPAQGRGVAAPRDTRLQANRCSAMQCRAAAGRSTGNTAAGSTATKVPAADEPPIWLYAALFTRSQSPAIWTPA